MKKVLKIGLMVVGGLALVVFGVYKFVWKPKQTNVTK